MNSNKLYGIGFGVVVGCTVLLTAIAVRAELVHRPPPPPQLKAIAIENRHELLEGGHRRGPADAQVTIVQFADFQCPACRVWNIQVLPKLSAEFPDDVAIVFRHWPLGYHPMAYPAARAAECAAAQGRFDAYHDSLYARQAEFSSDAFDKIAIETGVADLGAFRACRTQADPVPNMERGRAVALQLGGTGTPAFAVNGVFYPDGLSDAQLDSVVRRLINDEAR